MTKAFGIEAAHKSDAIGGVRAQVFTANVPVPNTVGDANCSLGLSIALRLVSDIGGEGNIVVFYGYSGIPACANRYDELRHVLKYYPKVRILQPELREVIPNTERDAYAQVTALIHKYPKGSIKAIWSAWDAPALGATQALTAAGRTEILTYSVDCRDTLDRLAQCMTMSQPDQSIH